MAESTDPNVPSIPVPPPAAGGHTPVVRPEAITPGYYGPPPPAPASPYVPAVAGVTAYSSSAGGAVSGHTQQLSIASMCCGIGGLVLSFIFLGFLPSLAAVITGHMASKRQPWARGFWVTGLITGYIGLVINLLIALFWIVIIAIAISETAAGNAY